MSIASLDLILFFSQGNSKTCPCCNISDDVCLHTICEFFCTGMIVKLASGGRQVQSIVGMACGSILTASMHLLCGRGSFAELF